MKQIFRRSKQNNTSQLSLFPSVNSGAFVREPQTEADKLLLISGSNRINCAPCAEKVGTTAHDAGTRAKSGSVRHVDFGDTKAAKRKNERQELSEKFLAYAEKLIW